MKRKRRGFDAAQVKGRGAKLQRFARLERNTFRGNRHRAFRQVRQFKRFVADDAAKLTFRGAFGERRKQIYPVAHRLAVFVHTLRNTLPVLQVQFEVGILLLNIAYGDGDIAACDHEAGLQGILQSVGGYCDIALGQACTAVLAVRLNHR